LATTEERREQQEQRGTRTMRYREALNEALREEMTRDESVFIMGEDIGVFNGAFKVTQGLLDEFGERRVRDTPISENTIVGMGVGAAMIGLRPVVELMTVNFSLLAMDQIVNSAAHIRYMFGGQVSVPLVVRMPQGAGHQLGPTHSHCFEALYTHVPGLLVAVPATPADAKGLLKAAIRDPDPVMFFEHKKTYRLFKAEVPDDDSVVPIGTADVARPGKHLSIFCYGFMRTCALEAAETLAREDGVEAEVVDLRTLRPLDLDTILASVGRTGKALVVHEANRFGGFGAEVAAEIGERAFESLDGPVTRLAGPEVPGVPFHHNLEDWFMVGPARIVHAARQLAAY
jgi:2-oxoisovalerate dehydrogenase E1 component beta subunit